MTLLSKYSANFRDRSAIVYIPNEKRPHLLYDIMMTQNFYTYDVGGNLTYKSVSLRYIENFTKMFIANIANMQ